MHLVRTFQSDTLEIEIIAPKIPSDFLSHDLFSRLYVVVCGQSEYANALQRYGKKTITDNLEEISQSFDINRIAAWDEDIEAMYKEEQGKHHQQTEFNIRNFFKSFPLFPNKLISSDVKRAVVESATLYKISASDMKSILLETIEYNKEIFDMRRFLNLVAKKHGVQSVSMVDNVQAGKKKTNQPVYSTEEEFDDEELKRLREELGINRDKEDA